MNSLSLLSVAFGLANSMGHCSSRWFEFLFWQVAVVNKSQAWWWTATAFVCHSIPGRDSWRRVRTLTNHPFKWRLQQSRRWRKEDGKLNNATLQNQTDDEFLHVELVWITNHPLGQLTDSQDWPIDSERYNGLTNASLQKTSRPLKKKIRKIKES